MNVEGKLAKVLGKDKDRLVVRAAERDAVLQQIDARAARYQKFDEDTYRELKKLRRDVSDCFNKGTSPGEEIMESLYFLDPQTKDFVEKLTRQYGSIVTPDDFSSIAGIMSEHLADKVPILKEFTRFFGKLAEEYVVHAKPKNAEFDWKLFARTAVFGQEGDRKSAKVPKFIAEALGMDPDTKITPLILSKLGLEPKPNTTWSDIVYGVQATKYRNTQAKLGVKLFDAFSVELKGKREWRPFGFKTGFYTDFAWDTKPELIGYSTKIGFAADPKRSKKWTQIPWVNFDGKVLEQKFTQTFEEKLFYRDKDGNPITNIVQVKQKEDPTWWEEFTNKQSDFADIVDAMKARTAYAVNGNHSNDATLVKNFHIWGADNGVDTSTIHDAFFTNAGQLLEAKNALRGLYAKTLERGTIKATLDEMKARGLPDEIYQRYMNQAIEVGLIPVAGKSKIGGKIVTDADILTKADILAKMPPDFTSNTSWYGIGG